MSLTKSYVVLLAVLAGGASFVGGLFAGHYVLPPPISGSLQPESVKVSNGANYTIPPAANNVYGSLNFGNVSTVGYQSVTMYVYVKSATGQGCQGLFFNGYWKPDPTFPAYSQGIPEINLGGGPYPFAASTTGSVNGGMISVVGVQTYGNTCSLSDVVITVFLR